MASFMIKLGGEGYVAQAHRKARPGKTAAATLVYEVVNIPDAVPLEDILTAFRKFAAPDDRFKIEYSELPAAA